MSTEVRSVTRLRIRRRFVVAAVVVTVLGLSVYRPYVQRRTTLRTVSGTGGSVSWGYTGPDWPLLVQLFQKASSGKGTPIFGKLESIRLDDTAANDATLAALGNLATLKRLSLTNTKVTDRGIETLECPNLLALHLDGTRVTDDVIPHVVKFSNLQALLLAHTQITSDGLRSLPDLKKLSSLDVFETQIGDTGLRHLRNCTSLRFLHLQRTQVSDDGLRHLKELSQLQGLYLQRTAVTDAGLVHIARIKQLEELDLSQTAVSDAGLKHLYRMTKLRMVDLRETRVTADGVEELKAALPKATIKVQ